MVLCSKLIILNEHCPRLVNILGPAIVLLSKLDIADFYYGKQNGTISLLWFPRGRKM